MGEGLVDRLREVEGLRLEVSWLPFQLNPDMPVDGVAIRDYFGARADRVADAQEGLRQRARELGLPFTPPERITNTHRAHCLARWAMQRVVGEAVHRGLFEAHFAEGKDIGKDEVLEAVGIQAGLTAGDVQQALEDPDCEREVQDSLARAGGLGITAVPTFLVAERYRIVGAHPFEALRDGLLRIQREVGD